MNDPNISWSNKNESNGMIKPDRYPYARYQDTLISEQDEEDEEIPEER